MARTDTLGHFLTDVADAIREKKGTSETIQASDFDTEIENLPSGADLSEYFNNTISSGTSSVGGWKNVAIKIPTVQNTGTSCANMFRGYPATTIDLSKFNTSSVSNFSYMFFNCTRLINLDLSNFDMSSATNIRDMFFGCSALTELILPNLNNINVNDLTDVFGNCSSLTRLDLSTLYTSNVTAMPYLFASCTSLRHLDIRNFTFDSMPGTTGSVNSMFTAVPTDCEIIVKSDTEKNWILNVKSTFTNIKTVAEYEAEQSE